MEPTPAHFTGTDIAAIIVALGTLVTSVVAAVVSVAGVFISLHNQKKLALAQQSINENTDTTKVAAERAGTAAERAGTAAERAGTAAEKADIAAEKADSRAAINEKAVRDIKTIVQNGHGPDYTGVAGNSTKDIAANTKATVENTQVTAENTKKGNL